MFVFMCTVCVSNTSDIGFNSSAKDIDQYFKTELNAENSLPLNSELILANELCKFGERAHDRNLISTVLGFEPTTSRYQYDEFMTGPENTHSYIFKSYNIHNYIYFHSSWMHCKFDVNLQDYASHISRI